MKLRVRDRLKLWLSSIPSRVQDTENVARYVYQSKQYKKGDGTLHRTAFQPPRDYPTEISVYRTQNLNELDVWKLSSFARQDKKPLAYGVIGCEIVRNLNQEADNDNEREKLSEVQLDLEAFPNPHYRHANITNIPKAGSGIEKALQKLVTMKLARKSYLIVKD